MCRSLPFLLAAILLLVAPAVVRAATPSAVTAALKTDLAASRSIESVCTGCGCRGGPGYRQANGKCASWGRRR